MSRDVRTRPISTKTLVRRLLDNPQLPAYIAHLDTPVLNRLIAHIGKEDAQELMRLASAQQIQNLVEMDTWQAERPGVEEKFDPARFLEWIELWGDMGADFLTERLKTLGAELLALTLDTYVVVIDVTEVGVLGGDVDTFHDYGVMPRDADQWPPIYRLLADVWNEDQAFLEEALARCCQRRSLLAEKTHIVSNDVLQQDVTGKRDRRREVQGYATPVAAALYLGQIRESLLDSLVIEVRYDLITGIQLRAGKQRHTRSSATDPVAPDDVAAGTDTDSEKPAGTDSPQKRWQELDRLLVAAEIVQPSPATLLLEAPVEAEELYLKQLLRRLGADNPAALDERLEEIVYLANILMAGCRLQGRVFSEQEAAECIYATCNLGLNFCLHEEPWDEEAVILASFLENEPGLIKAFRIGYHLIATIPHKVFMALELALRSPRLQRILAGHPWVEEHVRQEFVIDGMPGRSDRQRLARLESLIDSLEFAFDNQSCASLRVLSNELPCFPESLDPHSPVQVHVNKRWRFIQNPEDLQHISEFLDDLPSRLA